MYIHRAVRPKKVKRKAGQETNKEKKKISKAQIARACLSCFKPSTPPHSKGLCVYMFCGLSTVPFD